ncbi:hypothetical protein [Bacillus sp. CCB-MMP212]|nr:hypothetical protein [Bacillus sp. CCB-MMP212]
MLNSRNWINNWNETFHQIEKIKGILNLSLLKNQQQKKKLN